MNILVDCHVFDGPHQGTRTYLKGLYSKVIKLRPDISFYFAAHDVKNLRKEFGSHENVHFIKLNYGRYLRLLLEIPWIIYKHKIDYAHFQYISPLIKNCKFVVTIHDVLFNDFQEYFPLKYRIVKNLLYKISAKKAEILMTVSEYSRCRISYHYDIPLEKIKVTFNGLSNDFYNKENDLGLEYIKQKYNCIKYLLYVSRIEPRKNHATLLRAYNELQLWNFGYKLIFIGSKDLKTKDLDDYLKTVTLKCQNSFSYIQNVSVNELITLYKHASLFVYPSIAEGFGIPPLEAVVSGVETLCSNRTAMAEFSFFGDDFFNPMDLDELKSKIMKKINHKSSVERLASLKDYVKEEYSWTKSAESFIEAINALENNSKFV